MIKQVKGITKEVMVKDLEDLLEEINQCPGHFFIASNEQGEFIAVLKLDNEDAYWYGTGVTYREAIHNVYEGLRKMYEDSPSIYELEEEIARI